MSTVSIIVSVQFKVKPFCFLFHVPHWMNTSVSLIAFCQTWTVNIWQHATWCPDILLFHSDYLCGEASYIFDCQLSSSWCKNPFCIISKFPQIVCWNQIYCIDIGWVIFIEWVEYTFYVTPLSYNDVQTNRPAFYEINI